MVVKPEDVLTSLGSLLPYPYRHRRRVGSAPRQTVRPPKFTRFQKVRYEAGFTLCEHEDPSEMSIGEDFEISNADETRLVRCFKDADIPALYIIQEFVDMLSRSPLINILKAAFSVMVPAYYSSVDTRNDGQSGLIGAEKEEADNLRAYELFLESGVLEPLKKLTNVRRFAFDFALVSHLSERKLFQPKQRHLDIIDDLKTAIERNWVDKPGYPWSQCPNGKKDRKKKNKKRRKDENQKARLSIGASGGHASG